MPMAAPEARWLLRLNLIAIPGVAAAAVGVIHAILRRSYRRRAEEQKLAAIGTATARILHQIQNPLQSILLHADLLQDDSIAADATSRQEICDAIASEAERLAAMLGELSLFASGACRRVTLEPFPLHELLRELARGEARRTRIQVDASRVEECTVLADPYYLRQALENLIANARDALEGHPDPRLTLLLEWRGEMAVVGVFDNGPGIAPERLPSIFQPFVSAKTKGMGLGLAVSREIVEGHGGRIEAQSQPGVGTQFRVFLPTHGTPTRAALLDAQSAAG